MIDKEADNVTDPAVLFNCMEPPNAEWPASRNLFLASLCPSPQLL